mmetsp:Transcript_91981/g.213786  ORF Transcript_91981/g.213786 Transcript_91981/m.213786 type:complete len:214 (-) Transcript_91981:594-1235(-)
MQQPHIRDLATRLTGIQTPSNQHRSKHHAIRREVCFPQLGLQMRRNMQRPGLRNSTARFEAEVELSSCLATCSFRLLAFQGLHAFSQSNAFGVDHAELVEGTSTPDEESQEGRPQVQEGVVRDARGPLGNRCHPDQCSHNTYRQHSAEERLSSTLAAVLPEDPESNISRNPPHDGALFGLFGRGCPALLQPVHPTPRQCSPIHGQHSHEHCEG